MVEHPGRKAGRRICKGIQRLRPACHLLRVAQAVLVEEVELVIGVFLVVREAGHRRSAMEGLFNVVGNGGGHVGVNAKQFRRRQKRHLLGNRVAPIAALRDKLRISKALHQHDPGACNADGIPTELGRLP